MGTIIVVDEMDKLGKTITNYDEIIGGMESGLKSNNELFNEELEKIVNYVILKIINNFVTN